MAVTYEKTFEIEIINELSASVYVPLLMSKYCLFLIVIYYLTGGNN